MQQATHDRAAPARRTERLAKLLALLDSDQAGERAAAIAAARRLLERHGVRWSELFAVAPRVVHRRHDGAPLGHAAADAVAAVVRRYETSAWLRDRRAGSDQTAGCRALLRCAALRRPAR